LKIHKKGGEKKENNQPATFLTLLDYRRFVLIIFFGVKKKDFDELILGLKGLMV